MHLRTRTILFAVMTLLVAQRMNGISLAAESKLVTVTTIRLAGCKQIEPDFDRVLAAKSKDPAANIITQRLAAMDELTGQILIELRLHHDAFLDQTLATVGGAGDADRDRPQLLGANKIVEKYQPSFAGPVVPNGWDATDLQVVDDYLRTASATLTRLIQAHGRACISVRGVDVPEIIRLSFILPMLTADSGQANTFPVATLPKWMGSPTDLQTLEVFSAESSCPRVAFAITRADTATTVPSDLSIVYLSFIKKEADAMLRTAHYKAALVCLRDGISVANTAKLDADVTELSFRVAELLETTDSAKVAAQEMKRVQAICHDPNDYGRASMLRLKYLYEAALYDTLATEASEDLKDTRCDGYMPQIIYIAWVAARRQEHSDSDAWRKEFLDRYPDNPLGADMYFASAMDALSKSNYDEASRLLQFIEYRYPQSKIIDKVRKIQARLTAVGQNSATTQPASASIAASK